MDSLPVLNWLSDGHVLDDGVGCVEDLVERGRVVGRSRGRRGEG